MVETGLGKMRILITRDALPCHFAFTQGRRKSAWLDWIERQGVFFLLFIIINKSQDLPPLTDSKSERGEEDLKNEQKQDFDVRMETIHHKPFNVSPPPPRTLPTSLFPGHSACELPLRYNSLWEWIWLLFRYIYLYQCSIRIGEWDIDQQNYRSEQPIKRERINYKRQN